MAINVEKRQTVGPVAFEELDTVFFPKIKDPDAIASIIKRTHSWTADNLFLTQLIYRYVRQYSAQIIRTEGPNNIVDEIVHQKILKNWQTNEAAHLLCRIEQALHSFDCQDTLIVLYLQILWRKGIAANAQPKLIAEQNALIHSELVTVRQGQLQLSNRIYATVFGMDWIEQQLPGLTTRTVLTHTLDHSSQEEAHDRGSATSQSIDNDALEQLGPNNTNLIDSNSSVGVRKAVQSFKFVKALSTVALIAGGAAVLGVSLFKYFQAPNGFGAEAQPISHNTQIQNQPPAMLPTRLQQRPPGNTPQTSDPKVFFDRGLAHATNGRWLPMVQQFCSIPPTSPYFAPAKSQLARWIALYPQDVQQANSTFLTTQNASCSLLEDALKSVK